MAARNADSMTNAQGEFNPHKPRDEPLTTKGHKPGVITSDKDAAPEFSAQTLPAGTAPADRTFQPNPVSETPGQADNDAVLRSHGKESTYTNANDTLGGATSGDVHTGLGHPGQGQTSNEVKHDGQHTSKKVGSGLDGIATGGSGLRDEGSAEARRLERDTTEHGPNSAREHNATVAGSESKEPATAEEVASERA